MRPQPGGYRLAKRPIRQLAHDLFGVSISTGMVAKLERSTTEALEQPMAELESHAPHPAAERGRDFVAGGGAAGLAVGRCYAPGPSSA
jgi:hypothetical protein